MRRRIGRRRRRKSRPHRPTPPFRQKTVTRVLVVDDHVLVRDGIVEVLKRDSRMAVIGVVSDGVEAIAAVERYHPDVVLMMSICRA